MYKISRQILSAQFLAITLPLLILMFSLKLEFIYYLVKDTEELIRFMNDIKCIGEVKDVERTLK